MKPVNVHPVVFFLSLLAIAGTAYLAGSSSAVEKSSKVATVAAVNAAKPLSTPVVHAVKGVSEGLAQAAMTPMLDDIQANTNRGLLNIQVLNSRNLVAVPEPRCDAYVNLVMAAFQQGPDDKERMLAEALNRSYQVGCIRQKAPVEQMDATLRIFYETGKAKLHNTPKCTAHLSRVDEIAFGPDTVAHKRAFLAETFVVALEQGCSRP